MAVVNRVQLSDAVTHNRFSAEFFDPRYVFNPAPGFEWVPIGRVLKKCEYGLSISMNSEGRGFPMFRMNEIDGCFALRPEKYADIPKSLFDAYVLKPKDVLFNRTNSFEFVGRTGIVIDQTDCTFASYLIRLVPDSERLLPEFLTIYLNTRFGIGQIKRRAMRSINQANVSGSEVRRIPIPLPEPRVQQEVAELVNSAHAIRIASVDKYAEAQLLLESEMRLDKLTFQKPVGYTARFSEVQASLRIDSEHFYPEFEYIKSRTSKKDQFVNLGKDLMFCRRGKQPFYGETGLPVINSKHVQINQIILEGNRTAIRNPVRDLNIRRNDLLINGTGVGTIGRAAAYLTESDAVPDNHVTILRTRNLDPVYLSVFLNSCLGQSQVRKHQRGSSGQLELYPYDIARFLVWQAPKTIQLQIRNFIEQAHEAQRRSRELLERSILRVEQLIAEAVRS